MSIHYFKLFPTGGDWRRERSRGGVGEEGQLKVSLERQSLEWMVVCILYSERYWI